ncbi:hypothetical protein KNU94_gp31 [Xanthomonas phage FoX2]|uniref:Uncharacterized protein n=2 Tax=Foxunavirus TaxID=2948712 RepID=A0A858NNK6_9CAUD|nr:hypothetical protein KNU94_gp31 [Xanthomonas phage FoX2]YP_010106896.1 hypothetical protein KNU96_gp31 [Xanthomonas phage FoX5]QJB21850.1 hypothetical protein XccvBFoX2_gp31 [Xanthomonas phage FoX2]QJB22009.1 hypothetical protein XccvBFoX5_gp31 [Xanthomonas phage FoX5]
MDAAQPPKCKHGDRLHRYGLCVTEWLKVDAYISGA